MLLLTFLERILLLVGALVLIGQAYLNFYPSLRRCAFARPDAGAPRHAEHKATSINVANHSLAPFRLLALGDPQLEGDSSLPNPKESLLQSLVDVWTNRVNYDSPFGFARDFRQAFYVLLTEDLPQLFKYYRKRLDLLGNDYYLGQIYKTIRRTTQPTHITILGDLLGSQWISDEEFGRRSNRFWATVFADALRVEDHLMIEPSTQNLGEDLNWSRRLINVAGNHDVGYAGDMTEERVQRFESHFGKANWEVRFQLPSEQLKDAHDKIQSVPELRLIVLNSMNMDSPAFDASLQQQTYDFLNKAITTSRPVEDRSSATILLTHLPLYKEAGVCVDGPMFNFWGSEYGGGVREQNHLSYEAGKGILEGLYGMSGNANAPGHGMGRNGVILNGHDHEGCDTYHYISAHTNGNGGEWKAMRSNEASSIASDNHVPGVREITVRSMMGDYGGNAGLLSGWFDTDIGEWRFEYKTCPLGKQHIWWAVQVLQLIGLLLCFCILILLVSKRARRQSVQVTDGKKAGPPARKIPTRNGFSTGLDASVGRRANGRVPKPVNRQAMS
ncbi:hypothetical protein L228DRAFT_245440 [Xylona heveae TC161]|uniref:Uncharacterized protein n=1 Tax=Xylona heveae (strain CBS 132557 / TC161) TaxID=1328760 RepID=A0A165I7G9_XYLHT|nr:hypothetical protein L228DRAFT_245440 [Xylona heveae TC161]KZF24494.1 hypothetical protein L228DRAFT_245440 [Xylona heveae TC161]